MAALLHSLASRKLTIAWFFLLSACFFLSLGGDQTKQSWLASIGLQTNEPLRSLPVLVLFGILGLHLLLKPLARLVGRKRKAPIDDESEEESPLPSLHDQKRRSLYTSVSLAEVKTLIPYANLRAFLHFFRIELPSENENGEVLRTTYGSSRLLFLLFTFFGFLCLGGSILYRHGLFPAASMTLFSRAQQTQSTHPAPFKRWLHQKTSLWNQEPMDWGSPTKVRLAFAQKRERIRVTTELATQREARLEARWRTAWDGKAPKEKQSRQAVLETQSIGLQLPTQRTHTTLRIGQQKRIGTFLWTFVKQSNQLSIKIGEDTHVLEQGVPKRLSTHRLVFQGVETDGVRSIVWLFVAKDKERKRIGFPLNEPLLSTASFRWTGASPSIKISEQVSVAFLGLDFGAKLRYQPVVGAYLGWLGLFLFLIGFLGAWWQTRYRVEVLWGGDTGLVRIEGSGLTEQGKRITHVLQEALYFPIDWVAGPSPSKRPAGHEPSRPSARTNTQAQSPLVVPNATRPTNAQSALLVSPQAALPPVPTPPLFVSEPQEPAPLKKPSPPLPAPSNQTATPTPPTKATTLATPPSEKKPPTTVSPKTVPSAPATVPSPQQPVPTNKAVETPVSMQASTSTTKPPTTFPPTSQRAEPSKEKERRSTTDEFAAPLVFSASSKEEAFTEATAVSHRPDLLQQVRQSSPREASDRPHIQQEQKPAVNSRSPLQPQAPISFSPSSSPKPSTQKPLDMDALFGDILKEAPPGQPKEAAKVVEDDIDALFAQISTPKKA